MYHDSHFSDEEIEGLRRSNLHKVMDLVKELGFVLSFPKPFSCRSARPPWIMSV